MAKDISPEEMAQMTADAQTLRRGGMAAWHVILRRLDEAADKMLEEYDAVDFARCPERAINIQIYRNIVKQQIPRMVENLLNHNNPTKDKFSFTTLMQHLRTALTSGAER